jgi:hypothetical protein
MFKFKLWLEEQTVGPKPPPPPFKVGAKHIDSPEALEYNKKSGWKIHLAADPQNYSTIDRWLNKNHSGLYKLLRGGDPGEKDFTIYVGSKDNTVTLAKKIELEIGHLLLPISNSVSKEDEVITQHVAARFDDHVARTYNNYGRGGIPEDEEAGNARQQIIRFQQKGDLQTASTWQKFLKQHINKIHNDLIKKYGQHYTGTK